ncbi:AAA family ATPase [Peteryoungia ipomoeae]|uniref:Aminoglycoside phosphotransferase n=1 Tax=Peteryoungia ipomoeae TaxID=1210932 RepID=A0A4S8NUB4_9HYPH|nr:bifunctional aminoglycoside phosphotransferase/ATP-binding protein [Peteryoungia ipomoeae]THV20271.1 aminoglycoside phosphotransferase [Peteryoungia ipomoeae]
MQVDSQTDVIAFLSSAGTFGADAAEIIETHISLVFLAGDRAYKLKRAVKLPYADFTTLDLRRTYCLAEVRLNSRTAPEIYLGVRSVTREADGSLALDGQGIVLDYVVEMRRFSQEQLFDRLADGDGLTKPLMEATAEQIAAFHQSADIRHDGTGADNLAGVLAINEAAFQSTSVFPTDQIQRLNQRFRALHRANHALLDRRERNGAIRHCHGDLHLRNLFLGPEGPRMFDCIDFNDTLAVCDVLYDLAFLLMDLWHRQQEDLANAVANRYFDKTGDDAGYPLLSLFMAVRAAIRAHVEATQIAQAADPPEGLRTEAWRYLELAETLLRSEPARLVAIGGLSGTGKSTLAEALAPGLGLAPGARILESDRQRRALYGIARGQKLPDGAYAHAVSARVYETLRQKAETILAAGGSVIIDAVFDRQSERDAVQALSKRLGIPMTGLWLEAPTDTLLQRLQTRAAGDSDANGDVLRLQLSRDLGDITWHRLGSTADILHLVRQVSALLPPA